MSDLIEQIVKDEQTDESKQEDLLGQQEPLDQQKEKAQQYSAKKSQNESNQDLSSQDQSRVKDQQQLSDEEKSFQSCEEDQFAEAVQDDNQIFGANEEDQLSREEKELIERKMREFQLREYNENQDEEEIKYQSADKVINPIQISPNLEEESKSSNNSSEKDIFGKQDKALLNSAMHQNSLIPPRVYYHNLNKREELPILLPEGYKFGVWGILKNIIGKDITRIAVPIQLNEPISFLQRAAEQLEYEYLLQNAAREKNSLRRLAFVTAYNITSYSGCVVRGRKPFNPILGETYEIVTPNYEFLSEQVSHHPPICAFIGQGKGYKFWGNTQVTNHFRGTSLEFRPVGYKYHEFPEYDEVISVLRPDNSANNLLVGTIYLDVHGDLVLNNLKTQECCKLQFIRMGWTKSNQYKFEGNVYDAYGVAKIKIFGNWNDRMYFRNLDTGQEELVWKINKKPKNFQRMYGFNKFAANLNYLDEEMKQYLPPTDTRLRPDQRLYEEFKVDQASLEKNRLEEKQRTMKKERDQNNIPYKPLWFNEEIDTLASNGQITFNYNGNYFKKREVGDWNDCPDLF